MGEFAMQTAQQELRLQMKPELFVPDFLLEEIPYQTKSNHEITIWIIWCCVKIISSYFRIKMFCFEENPRLTNPGIDKEIHHWKIANFFLVLDKCFCCYRIIIVDIIFCKIIKRKTCLQIQCFFEIIISKVK